MADSGTVKKMKKQTKTSSTTSLANGLTCTEIVRILGACKRSGIRTFEYQGLKLSLDDTVTDNFWPDASAAKLLDNGGDVHYNGNDTEVIDKIDESTIEELKISNPQAYEEIMERMS